MSLILVVQISCVSVIIYTYCIYPILLFFIVKHRKKTIPKSNKCVEMHVLPKISLIIPAYNEEEFISVKLKNSLSLIYPSNKIEIMY